MQLGNTLRGTMPSASLHHIFVNVVQRRNEAVRWAERLRDVHAAFAPSAKERFLDASNLLQFPKERDDKGLRHSYHLNGAGHLTPRAGAFTTQV